MQELLSRAQRTAKDMEAVLSRRPSRAEIAAELGVEIEKLNEVYDYVQVGAGRG
jgi:DNA-directed RNA polymerase specialized sigma subunit